MIGFEVIAPKSVAFTCRRKRQRTSSRGIVRASSSVAVTARWLAGPPFAETHDWLPLWPPHPAVRTTAATHPHASTNLRKRAMRASLPLANAKRREARGNGVAEQRRPRREVDRAARPRREARERLPQVLPEVQRLAARGCGKSHGERPLRVGPALGQWLDDLAAGSDADDETGVDGTDLRRRRLDRVRGSVAQLDVQRRAPQPLERRVRAERAAVGDASGRDADGEDDGIRVRLVRGRIERRVVAVRVRRGRVRPEVAVLRARDHDRTLHGVATRIRDRAGELIREEMNRRRRLTARPPQPSGHENAAVLLPLLAEAREPVADAEAARRPE